MLEESAKGVRVPIARGDELRVIPDKEMGLSTIGKVARDVWTKGLEREIHVRLVAKVSEQG